MKWVEDKKLNWGDVTLSQFQELEELEPSGDELDDMLMKLSVLTDETIEELERRDVETLLKMMKSFDFLLEVPKEKKIDVIEIGDKKYGLCDLDNMSLAQFVDIESYVKDGLIKNLHRIMSVLYLPIVKQNIITKKYELEQYEPSEERETLILGVGMDKIYPTLLFFYRIVNVYLKIIRLYSLQLMETQMEMKAAEMKMMMMEMDEEQLMILNKKLNSVLENNGTGMD